MAWAGFMLSGGAANAAPPIAAYGQLPGMSSVTISPDGARFAAILGDETKAEIQIRNTTTGQLVSASATARDKLRSLQWAGPDHLIATISTTAAVYGILGRHEWFAINDFNVATRKWKPLLANIENGMNVISGSVTVVTIDGKPALIVPGIYIPGDKTLSTLFRIYLESGRAVMQEAGTAETIDWVIGSDGKAVARTEYAERSGEWRLFTRPSGQANWQRGVTKIAPVDRPNLLSLGRDDGSVLVSTRGADDWQVQEVSVADGSWSPPRADLDADLMITDPATNRLIGSLDIGLDSVDYRFSAEADQRAWRSITRAFPGDLVNLSSWSNNHMTAIVEVDGPTNGDAFFIVDRKAKTAQKLGDRYPGIAAADIAPVRSLRYKAADGMEIPAYLTLPRGRPAKGLPLVVLVHGGPASRDDPGFDWWAQAIASRGYAVLQSQFRGSSGFGAAYRDAGFGQWGRKMQTDLSDGVRKLVADGIVDPKKVCITGASYGGYAALAGPTLDPGVYRCAAAIAGVSDLRRMLENEIDDRGGNKQNRTLRYWQRFMGATNATDPRLDAISPARLAARVTIPVLLIHGKDDTVVRYEQSTIMEKALRDAGANVELVTLAGEDHWLSRATTRVQMLTALIGFLEKNNPPAPVVAGMVAATGAAQ